MSHPDRVVLPARGCETVRAHRSTESTPVGILLGIIGLIIWIAIAFWPARVAGRKGHSFIGYFILSLFFFPLAIILAYVVSDRTVA
jgi:hypothetical protein